MKNYKTESLDKIAANEKSIAEFNARTEHEKKEAKADYKAKIAELEQRNTDMKKKMDDYKEDGKENWEKFKVDFNLEMDELNQSFTEFKDKHTK